MIQKYDKKKTIAIKRLQNKNRYLKRKIKNFKTLLRHLRTKGFVSEECEETIMVNTEIYKF